MCLRTATRRIQKGAGLTAYLDELGAWWLPLDALLLLVRWSVRTSQLELDPGDDAWFATALRERPEQ